MFLPLLPMPWPSYFLLHLSVFSSSSFARALCSQYQLGSLFNYLLFLSQVGSTNFSIQSGSVFGASKHGSRFRKLAKVGSHCELVTQDKQICKHPNSKARSIFLVLQKYTVILPSNQKRPSNIHPIYYDNRPNYHKNQVFQHPSR